jgi:ADP-heptose:LPS heptosyltransferase
MDNIQRIGVIMYGLLGDVLMRTPIVKEIKKQIPNVKIIAFVDPVGKYILEHNQDIDQIIITDRTKKNRWKYLKNKIISQYKLASMKLDMVIDLYGGPSTHKMMRLSGVKYQIGLKYNQLYTNRKELLIYDHSKLESINPYHLTHKLWKVLSFLDIDKAQIDTKPIINTPDADKLRSYISSIDNFQNEYYLISLGSGGLEKLISEEKSFGLVEYIYTKYNLKPAIISNPGQEYLQEDLINNYLIPKSIPYVKLPTFSISEITALMQLSKFIIVPDTGLYHIAIGVGVPTFTVFTYTNPELVRPSSGIFQACYQETDQLDKFGLKICDKDIGIEKIKRCFDSFYQKL